MKKNYTREMHNVATADLALWHRAWDVLLTSEKPLTVRELAGACGVSRDRMNCILTSLSAHGVPVYEESAGRAVFYGICRPISHRKMDELIGCREAV
jgi:predicted transcriptional regulator